MADHTLGPMLRVGEAEFVRDFLSVVNVLRTQLDLDELELLLASGRFEQAMQMVADAANRLGTTYTTSYVRSGQSAGNWLEREVGDILFDFDQTNTRAVRAMQANRARLVREFSEQQRRSTTQALQRGIARGANPREQARAFRDSIGLTQKQEGWVANYERQLRNNDPAALRRRLRDARSDRAVRNAIARGTPLTDERIEAMVGRYRARMIRHRSEVIARTEALRSVHEGTNEMFQQAFDDGSLSPEQMEQEWQTGRDERVRRSHSPMHGQLRPIGQPFISGKGRSLRYPGDTLAPADETILCRCSVSTRMVSFQGVQPAGVNVTVIESVL